METAGSAQWTTDDIKTLLDAMKKSIEKRERNKIWSVGLKTLDWNKVAFEDFTAEECNAKWQEIMQKLRKIKTITELIVDAQNAIDNTLIQFKPTPIQFPKKPVSANALFFAEHKDILKKNKPGMNSRELMKFANDSYKKLSSEKKEKYVQKVQKAKEEYLENTKKLLALHPDLRRQDEGKKTKTAFSINETKQAKIPGNGYNLFCREQKSLLTGIPQKELTAVWSRRWKELPEEEKKKYSRRCKEMKDEAKRKQNDGDQLGKNKTKFLFPGEPKMPARSICGLYCKNQMKKMKGEVKGARNRFAAASHRSKNLSQQEKEQYQEIINTNFSAYKEQLKRWFGTLTPTQQLKYCEQNPKKIKYLKIKKQVGTQLHRTSDSEDEDFEDSCHDDDDGDDDDDDDDDDAIEVVFIDDEEEETPMFDLF